MTVLRPNIAEPEPLRAEAPARPERYAGNGAAWAYDTPTVPRMARVDRIDNTDRLASHVARAELDHVVNADLDRAGAGEFGRLAGLDRADSAKLIRLHESIAALLSSRGEWRQAYQHLRSALDLVYSDRAEQPPVPEQLRREVDRLRREHAEAREQSMRDSLTASYNRRYLDQRLTSLLADRTAGGLAVALVDLDWFKQVNDTFGHLIGDRVLRRVVELLSDGLPDGAFCARYGGEEFVLVVPRINAVVAIAIAEAARARVEHNAWSHLVPGLRVTVSVGLAHQPATLAPGRSTTSAEQQLLRADGLLYAAKQSGRNAVAYRRDGRVVLAGAAASRRSIAEPRDGAYSERGASETRTGPFGLVE